MPPVRNYTAIEDPRVLDLVANNAADPYWDGFRPDQRVDDDLDVTIPRAWRAKGYEPVAELISAWIGRPLDVGTVRGWWRLDLQRRRSQSLPPPDAIIKRRGGVLLPGWADQTIREWLSNKDRPFKPAAISMTTYLEWDSTHDEVDPAVVALINNNRARGVPMNEQGTTVRARVEYQRAAKAFDVPLAYLALGHEPAARVIAAIQGRPLSEDTVRKAWASDVLRPEPWSQYIAMPDALISRGSAERLLPGWAGGTIEAWVPTRPGSGNHTRGDQRRGHNSREEKARLAGEVVSA